MGRQSSRALWTAKIEGKSMPKQSVISIPKAFKGTILGVDPSLRGTGLALMSFGANREITLHMSQTVRNTASIPMEKCLVNIFNSITELIDIKEVTHVAMEQTVYVQNVQTAQILGAVRGAVMTAAALKGLPIFEYPPLRVKQAVVGHGKASKDQVARTVMQHLGHTAPLASDEADAAATAICHAFTHRE